MLACVFCQIQTGTIGLPVCVFCFTFLLRVRVCWFSSSDATRHDQRPCVCVFPHLLFLFARVVFVFVNYSQALLPPLRMLFFHLFHFVCACVVLLVSGLFIGLGTIKDAVTRYAHQTGHYVSRRAGWDCHGLPVEFEIDTALKITHRDQVKTSQPFFFCQVINFKLDCLHSLGRVSFETSRNLLHIRQLCVGLF